MSPIRPEKRTPRPLTALALTPRAPAPLAVLLCSLGAALAALALPALLGSTLSRLVAGGPVPWTGIRLCLVLTAAEVLLDAAVAALGGAASAGRTARLRGLLLGRVLAAAPDDRDLPRPGDLATRLTANTAEAATVPVTLATAVPAVLLPLGGLAGVLLTDLWTGLALLAGFPAVAVLLRVFTTGTAEAGARYQHTQAVLASRLTEVLEGAETVRAAGTARREFARVTAPLAELAAHGRTTWLLYGRAAGRAGVLLPLLTVLVLAVAGLRLAAGALDVGALVAVTRYTALAVGIGTVTGALGALARGRAAAGRLTPLLALCAPPSGSAPLPPGGGALTLRGVGLRREGADVLCGIDLDVVAGEYLAVVGRSGAGKSHLVAVAGGLVVPSAGRVLLDGADLRDLDPGALRRAAVYAFERPVLFGDTIGDALAFGAARADGATVRAGAQGAAAHAFVRALPEGYATPVDAAPLSGGEHQRLGLARAFAHPGRLLVLDDATSALDTLTEREVHRHVARLPVTRLHVTHRPAVAARADRVLWLDAGRVRGCGPHAELWQDAAYREVFTGGSAARPAGADQGGLAC
ncbi:putative ABC transporter ATP-binding membrane translocator, AmfB [Streptomyces sp. Tu6071]|uniref:ATP-binding cassette domain-containing protein n=1 Tax=Streptomyces sp. Tu6071 TaxID=355249 RepID=UPI00020E6B13|nr:ABC transporter ATP-binding protein [Streptomyces sp. Tu6071]EGJ78835.1 putative ABC transporter ATP-binding membrane translocator, AmfB [Streptomyces sp. Tu6071]